MNIDLVIKTCARLVVFFTAIPIHESAHAFVAYKLGDPTAKNAGRISMNPLRHFDLIGTLCLLFVGIGWARPVPIDARYFKNPRGGMALSAAAGPLSNLAVAYVSMIIYKVVYYATYRSSALVWEYVALLFYYMTIINVVLAIFNLLPVPPFDGSRIFLVFLPQKAYFAIMKYERYIYLAVVALVYIGVLDKPLAFLENGVLYGLDYGTFYVDYFAAKLISRGAAV